MQYHEWQQEYCSSYLAQKWQMRADQVFLFEMLEQLDRRLLQNVDDAAQAPWRPTQSCQLSTKVWVHVGICAPRHTSWTGSCDAPGASGVPHEWRLRCDHISVFSESDVQQSEERIAVVGAEPHRHDSEHCCSSRFDSEWMRAPASLQHAIYCLNITDWKVQHAQLITTNIYFKWTEQLFTPNMFDHFPKQGELDKIFHHSTSTSWLRHCVL